MKIQNVNADNLKNLGTIDALNFLNILISKRDFTEAETVHVGLSSKIVDKVAPLMTNVTVLVQTFSQDKYFILTQSRGTDFGCSNGITVKQVTPEEWRLEANFIKRYNELVG